MEQWTVAQTAKNIREGRVSAREVADFYFKRAEKFNSRLNAFITLNENLLDEADGAPDGPLKGVPLGIKDMFCTEGLRTTAASRMLENFIPPYSATVVERLKKAGALVLGKCNHDEFAMGSTGDTSFFGVSKNPWNTEHTAGGSSGGSASAVAGRLCPGAFGTDTGGSVRQPAHFCHLVGVKPSYGRVSRYGMIAYGSSLDQAGTLTRTVEDGALLLDAVVGPDPKDSTTADIPPPFFHRNLDSRIKSLTVGFFPWEEFLKEGPLRPSALKAVQTALNILRDRGCRLKECRWPLFGDSLSAYYLISTSEASGNLARYDGVRYGFRSSDSPADLKEFYGLNRGQGFGSEVKQRILMGTFCLSSGYYNAYYQKAAKARSLIKKGFEGIFKECDVVLCPVSSTAAFPIRQKEKPLKTYLNDIFTVSANLAGIPALSLPVHFTKKEEEFLPNGSKELSQAEKQNKNPSSIKEYKRGLLPAGVQLMGPAFGEQKLLNTALALEEDLNVCGQRPDDF